MDMNESQQALLETLRAKRASYHLEHPFEQTLRRGELTREQLQGWLANRFYYQMAIPRKDAAILSQCPDREIRRSWIRRIHEQDGSDDEPGGMEAWIAFGNVLGLGREEMLDGRYVLPSVRFAVESYVTFCQTSPWQEGVCACLTELFAGEAHAARIEAFRQHYDWIPTESLTYFQQRQEQVKVDVDEALRVALDYFAQSGREERAVEILQMKLDILWVMADAIYTEFVERGKSLWRD